MTTFTITHKQPTFADALKYLCPQGWAQQAGTDGTQIDHFTFEGGLTPPRQSDVEEALARLQAAQYQTLRRLHYPDATSFMEAYMEATFENKPAKLNALQAERTAVKARFPKP